MQRRDGVCDSLDWALKQAEETPTIRNRPRKAPEQQLENQESVPSRSEPTTPQVTRSGRKVNGASQTSVGDLTEGQSSEKGEFVRTDEHLIESRALPLKEACCLMTRTTVVYKYIGFNSCIILCLWLNLRL